MNVGRSSDMNWFSTHIQIRYRLTYWERDINHYIIFPPSTDFKLFTQRHTTDRGPALIFDPFLSPAHTHTKHTHTNIHGMLQPNLLKHSKIP